MKITNIIKTVAGQLFAPRHLPRNLMITLIVAGILAGVVAILYNQGLLQQGLNHLGASVSTSPNLIATIGMGGGGAAAVGIGLLGSTGLILKHLVEKRRSENYSNSVVESQPRDIEDESDEIENQSSDTDDDKTDNESDDSEIVRQSGNKKKHETWTTIMIEGSDDSGKGQPHNKNSDDSVSTKEEDYYYSDVTDSELPD